MAGINATRINEESVNASRSSPLSAILWLRWRLFSNSLRTTRGQLELASRILVSLAFVGGGVGGGFGMAAGAYFMISHGKPQLIALLFWAIFLFGNSSLL